MSCAAQHARMKPVLNLARKLDIASNPDPRAIFECGSAGFQVWITPSDHPDDENGWNRILDKFIPGAFSKPCSYLASACWLWEGEKIIAVLLETTAYGLKDHLPQEFNSSNIYNRPVDTEFAMEKIKWLCSQAGVPCPPIKVGEEE